MLNFKPLKPITEEFFKTANLRATAVMEANCSAEKLMETLAGDVIWTQWAPALKKVEWTSPKPYGPGAKRTVQKKISSSGKTRSKWRSMSKKALCPVLSHLQRITLLK